ncbi:adenylosuccinate synthase [candidate division WOR-3 bacterium JGI_Cruoil_03_44_89]|uniref:Adenylosuccinate synthetase n=1 Tax=candidate division WOR-3 bacterium JGI_Cruoil_03_44_89 TaxID=1973748 RepID=A0A235BZ53_UNCW3|nr:MAG: adenylosuccinate synthase [candidate division WOR-3 bacterium JGI_Cruoil_03_44_89]
MITVVIGTHFGDEGKGKIVDYLARDCHMVVRYNGGNNAGHTIISPRGKLVLHLIPAGIFNPDCICIIGPGVVIRPGSLYAEMDALSEMGINLEGRLFISSRAHIVMPWHLALDELEDKKKKIGTTRRGIGPTYSDKTARNGIRAGDALLSGFKKKVREMFNERMEFLKREYKFTLDEDLNEWLYTEEKIGKYITDTEPIIWNAMECDKNILLEGAQGTLLDIDFGTFPFVTSSSTTASGACQGSGIPPMRIDRVIGVVKAYTTRVGEGPLPTEIKDETGEMLREKGGEYGATTGRPRRCGWLDGVLLRYAVKLSGITSLALTKLDVLSGFGEIKICEAYRRGDKRYTYPPFSINDVQPVYKILPGWNDIEDNLPQNAFDFIKAIENISGTKVGIVSTGPERNATMIL